MLDLELSASFLALVRERHYGRAAAQLHITTAALTKRIQRLEHQVGVTLLDRGPEGVVGPTAAGIRFAQDAAPLITQAERLVKIARASAGPPQVKLGVPAGTVETFEVTGMARAVRAVRQEHPLARFTKVNVPFPTLRTCLPEHQVDVLITVGPVHDPAVDSVPLPVSAERIGLVHAAHDLAGATELDVAEFAEQPTIFNPAVPDEFMRWFWLGDLRPRREANLVQIDATHAGEASGAVTGRSTMVTLSAAKPHLPPSFSPIRLIGSTPVPFFAARRREDSSPVIHCLLRELRTMPPVHL